MGGEFILCHHEVTRESQRYVQLGFNVIPIIGEYRLHSARNRWVEYMGAQRASGFVTFGHFEVDFASESLRNRGTRVRLPAQSFQVLRVLLDRPGEIVSRPDLQRALWPEASYGDFEHGLNAAVNRLREALGDSADNPKFIETLPRRGYRFIAVLQPEHLLGASSAPAASQLSGITAPHLSESPGTSHPVEGRNRPARAVWVVLLLLGAGLLVAFLAQRRYAKFTTADQNNSPQRDGGVSVTPLTALPGRELAPAFSPDASQVVFAWDGGKPDAKRPFDLYAKVIGSERLERLTHQPAEWIVPAWSPDGRNIAFARKRPDDSGIFMIPALGGPERRLAPASFGYTPPINLSWSPDGRTLLYASDDGMHALTPESGEVRTLPTPSRCNQALTPTFSPDGQWIAFSCYSNAGLDYELEVMAVGSGVPRSLVRVHEIPQPMAWSSDSERIIFTAREGLTQISREGGAPRLLSFAHDAAQPAVSVRAGRLAYAESTTNVNLWRLAVGRSGAGTATLLTATSREQRAPDISPDGRRLVFESTRSGAREVWVSNLDGSEAVQLSNYRSISGTGRWSPDGKLIVFDSREAGEAGLYLVDPQTALPRRIPVPGMAASVPTWSRDGQWIYFRGDTRDRGGIYKVSPQGGEVQLVSATLGYNAQEAKNGPMLYFASGESDAAIHVLDRNTGKELPLRGMPNVATPTDWVVSAKGLYFLDQTARPDTICFYDFAAARVTRRMPIPKPTESWGGLALAPDESWLAYAQVDRNDSDLMLASGFR